MSVAAADRNATSERGRTALTLLVLLMLAGGTLAGTRETPAGPAFAPASMDVHGTAARAAARIEQAPRALGPAAAVRGVTVLGRPRALTQRGHGWPAARAPDGAGLRARDRA